MAREDVAKAIRRRHRKDAQALLASMSEDEQGAFTDGFIIGAYYAGYTKGVTAAIGVMSPGPAS